MHIHLIFMLLLVSFLQAEETENDIQSDPAQKKDCDCKPVDGKWTEWSGFTPCTATCGTGRKTRYRYCARPMPQLGGKNCPGKKVEFASCNSGKKCPVNGRFGKWKNGKCSTSCGSGTQTQTRSCSYPAPANCGKDCVGASSRVVPCHNKNKCIFNMPTCLDRCKKKACHSGLDLKVGCNQKFSCPHACKIRELGVGKAECDKLCERNGQSGCFPVVRGYKFNLCRACQRKGCGTWPNPKECRVGCL